MRGACALLLSTLFCAMAADSPVIRPLAMVMGKGELLQFDHDIVKVVVAEPKIADAIVVSPRDVMLTAKGQGHTTLVIWETGSSPARYDVSVSTDTTELDNLRKSLAADLRSAMPD